MMDHHCPPNLPTDLLNPLRTFSQIWAASSLRPHPSESNLVKWRELIQTWADCENLPLFIRKASSDRGQYLIHTTGRVLVPVDNSPAHWSFSLCLRGDVPSVDEIKSLLNQDQIPVAMVMKKEEKVKARLKCTRGKTFNLNSLGWKLAHIENVGWYDRGPIISQPIERLMGHFMRLMSPANMFLIPLSLQGLAEIEVVVEEIKKFTEKAGINTQ